MEETNTRQEKKNSKMKAKLAAAKDNSASASHMHIENNTLEILEKRIATETSENGVCMRNVVTLNILV